MFSFNLKAVNLINLIINLAIKLAGLYSMSHHRSLLTIVMKMIVPASNRPANNPPPTLESSFNISSPLNGPRGSLNWSLSFG